MQKKTHFKCKINPSHMFTVHNKVQICTTEYDLIKGFKFKQSFFHSVSVSLSQSDVVLSQLLEHNYQLWQLSDQSVWQGMLEPSYQLWQLSDQSVWQGMLEPSYQLGQLSDQGVWQGMLEQSYQLWQLSGQSVWPGTGSTIVHCLHQFLATLLVSHYSFACRIDHISQLSIMSQKTIQKTLTWLGFFP